MTERTRLATVSNHVASHRDHNFSVPKPAINSIEQYRAQSSIKNSSKALYDLVYQDFQDIRKAFFDLMASSPHVKAYRKSDLSRDNQRYVGLVVIQQIREHFSMTPEQYLKDSRLYNRIAEMIASVDLGIWTKIGVHSHLYLNSLLKLGTDKHRKFLIRALEFKDIGCFGLTELGHGSNAKQIETQARYDHATQEFVINTPNNLAMKVWIGGAAQTTTMCCVFAQLYVDGICYGPHAFLVRLRNKRTHELMPGIIIGDMGKKMGLDVIDNGFIIFKNVRIPKTQLLDRLSKIDDNGVFQSEISSMDKRFGLSLSALSIGRLGVSNMALGNLRDGLMIGLRYSAMRRQFGNPKNKASGEVPILEYQTTQYRLIPYVAGWFARWFFLYECVNYWEKNHEKIFSDPTVLQESHLLASIAKPLASSYTVKGLNEVREVCAGLGYSAYSRIAELLANCHVHLTWEGDNNVLCQGVSRMILDATRKMITKGKKPPQSVAFVNPGYDIDAEKVPVEKLLETSSLLKIMTYRVNKLLKQTMMTIQQKMADLGDAWEAWNQSQIYGAKDLALAFGEALVAQNFAQYLERIQDESLKIVMTKFFQLDCLKALEGDGMNLSEEGYFTAEHFRLVKENILRLCAELKGEVIHIFDVIGTPDAVVDSPLGCSDGDMYNKFITKMIDAPGCFEKPSWWDNITLANAQAVMRVSVPKELKPQL